MLIHISVVVISKFLGIDVAFLKPRLLMYQDSYVFVKICVSLINAFAVCLDQIR